MSTHAAITIASSALPPDGISAQVMAVLRAVRATAVNGEAHDEETRLADAGFTSMEMVNVMLAIEGAFDVTIPQNEITPSNFATPAAIAAMVRKLKA